MITINPCQVTNFINVQAMGDITYRLGNPDLTQGTYSVQDSPGACGYEQTFAVTGLPAFAMHDESSRTFTVFETLDHSLIGRYPVKITVSVSVPNDYTKTSFTTKTHE